jgi:hypothetical protein
MMLGWLTSFDTESPYATRRVDIVQAVVSGEHSDYLWVRISPPLCLAKQETTKNSTSSCSPRAMKAMTSRFP